MTYMLRVEHKESLLFSCPIDTIYGRTLTLLALMLPNHLQERPQDAEVAIGRLVRTIEDALQENLEAHQRWMTLCASQSQEPAVVDIVASPENTKTSARFLCGGEGGDGGWPAGGGGGGGSGLLGSNGGRGADGALLLFQYDLEENLVDIDALVLPDTGKWMRPRHVVSVKAMLFGGGGGGGSATYLAQERFPLHGHALRSLEHSLMTIYNRK